MTQFLRKWFGGSKTENSDTTLVNVAPPVVKPSIASEKMQPLVASCTRSVGRQRDHNEDSSFTLTSILENEDSSWPYGLYIVADGMGGHTSGEIASGIAIRKFSTAVMNNLVVSKYQGDSTDPEANEQQALQSAIQEAHQGIIKGAPGGGTTLTAALLMKDQITIVHVGDSRAYSISNNHEIKSLTNDHSLVSKLVELGQITPEEAARHPQRNVLYRALGQGEPFEADIVSLSTKDIDYLLICSDGLWGLVPEQEMLRIITSATQLQLASQQLVDSANAAGGPDNITAILVRLPIP